MIGNLLESLEFARGDETDDPFRTDDFRRLGWSSQSPRTVPLGVLGHRFSSLAYQKKRKAATGPFMATSYLSTVSELE